MTSILKIVAGSYESRLFDCVVNDAENGLVCNFTHIYSYVHLYMYICIYYVYTCMMCDSVQSNRFISPVFPYKRITIYIHIYMYINMYIYVYKTCIYIQRKRTDVYLCVCVYLWGGVSICACAFKKVYKFVHVHDSFACT